MTAPIKAAMHQFWTTHLYQYDWPDHAQEAPGIARFLYELRDAQQTPIASGIAVSAKPSEGLYESDFDLFARDHPSLNRLKAFIVRCLQQTVWHVNGGKADPKRVHVEIVDSWFHITTDGGFHDAHYHGGCSWCGIYYLQTGECGRTTGGGAPNGGNRFYSPIASGGAYKDYGNAYLNFSYVDPPVSEGALILFPSYLLHSGLPYRGKQDRIVISFNSRSALTS